MALNVGIAGLGAFGRFLREAWSDLEDVRVVAVADEDERRDSGDVRFYADIFALLRDPDVDLVSIATPPSTHADIACDAMHAGKHVLIEKPLALSNDDARRICATRDETGRIAGVNYMLRFNPIVEAVQAWCRGGGFGKLRRVAVENYAQDETLAPDHWFWDRRISGGILVEHAVHFIDVVHGCTTAGVERVDGITLDRSAVQQDRAMATVTYADGLVATQYHAFSRPAFFERTSMRFVFDLAQIDIQGWIPMKGTIHALVSDESIHRLDLLPGLSIASRHPIPNRRKEFPGPSQPIRSGGERYRVNEEIHASFALRGTKREAYRHAVRAMLTDLRKAINDLSHPTRVSLEDGCRSLATALAAVDDAARV